MVIDCRSYLDHTIDVIKELKKKGEIPDSTFHIFTAGDDAASKVYINMKLVDFKKCGIKTEVHHFDSSQGILHNTNRAIREINDVQNNRAFGDGLIVQLPLPKDKFNTDHILRSIDERHDVDGLSIKNTSLNYSGKVSACTAVGIVNMLKREKGISLDGALVTVIGRSDIVGKPLIPLLLKENATVISCNSHTDSETLMDLCRMSNVIIVAVGKPKFLKAEFIKPYRTLVVDVGINRVDGKLVGDVDYENVAPKAFKITSVPGGVGLLTRAELLRNFIRLNGVPFETLDNYILD